MDQNKVPLARLQPPRAIRHRKAMQRLEHARSLPDPGNTPASPDSPVEQAPTGTDTSDGRGGVDNTQTPISKAFPTTTPIENHTQSTEAQPANTTPGKSPASGTPPYAGTRAEGVGSDRMRDRGKAGISARSSAGMGVPPALPNLEVDRSDRLSGLGKIPSSWPELPANASLQVEIGWVQANRLSVVEETPGGATIVRLERAHEPAPSRAALGWLETSIRSYAKFVDVVAKSLASGSDDKDQVRRERMKLEDVRRLLDEMRSAPR